MGDVSVMGARSSVARAVLNKVPEVTIVFWIVKILATTVGETGGDALSMQLGLGYAASTVIFLAFFVVTVTMQVVSTRYRPWLYRAVVVATTTVGTTTSDYLDRTLRLGYVKSSIMLFVAVLAVLMIGRIATGHLAFKHVVSRADEGFYWVTILVSNTLGTALGDFTATSAGLGFEGGAFLFAGLLGLIAMLHARTRVPSAVLFWAAYVLTRPLGATLGDTLTKPYADGGLNLSRIASSLVIALLMVAILLVARNRRSVA